MDRIIACATSDVRVGAEGGDNKIAAVAPEDCRLFAGALDHVIAVAGVDIASAPDVHDRIAAVAPDEVIIAAVIPNGIVAVAEIDMTECRIEIIGDVVVARARDDCRLTAVVVDVIGICRAADDRIGSGVFDCHDELLLSNRCLERRFLVGVLGYADVGGCAKVNVVADHVHLALDRLDRSADEIDETFFVLAGGVFEVENDGELLTERIGGKLNVIEAARLEGVNSFQGDHS